MRLTAEQGAEMVAAGGRWLDVRGPAYGWLDRVDLDRLDIRSSDDCVLGQVFRDRSPGETGYAWACRMLPPRTGTARLTEMGFFYPYEDPEDYAHGCATLTEAWRYYITARRAR